MIQVQLRPKLDEDISKSNYIHCFLRVNFLIPQENLICKQPVVLHSLSLITGKEFVTVVPCLSFPKDLKAM